MEPLEPDAPKGLQCISAKISFGVLTLLKNYRAFFVAAASVPLSYRKVQALRAGYGAKFISQLCEPL